MYVIVFDMQDPSLPNSRPPPDPRTPDPLPQDPPALRPPSLWHGLITYMMGSTLSRDGRGGHWAFTLHHRITYTCAKLSDLKKLFGKMFYITTAKWLQKASRSRKRWLWDHWGFKHALTMFDSLCVLCHKRLSCKAMISWKVNRLPPYTLCQHVPFVCPTFKIDLRRKLFPETLLSLVGCCFEVLYLVFCPCVSFVEGLALVSCARMNSLNGRGVDIFQGHFHSLATKFVLSFASVDFEPSTLMVAGVIQLFIDKFLPRRSEHLERTFDVEGWKEERVAKEITCLLTSHGIYLMAHSVPLSCILHLPAWFTYLQATRVWAYLLIAFEYVCVRFWNGFHFVSVSSVLKKKTCIVLVLASFQAWWCRVTADL